MSTPANQLPERDTERSPLRFVTAASLFDGHDAAINIMRRLIQAQGVEVVHLGHNRSVEDVVRAALQEDADGIALSSYQGGHTEYFKYMVDMLRERGAGQNGLAGRDPDAPVLRGRAGHAQQRVDGDRGARITRLASWRGSAGA